MAKQDRSKTDFIYLIIAYFLSIYKERQWYINERKFNDTDLIEKAMGWILRECGNKNM
jgi:3-methyladenine DNA glycosylase AlkD